MSFAAVERREVVPEMRRRRREERGGRTNPSPEAMATQGGSPAPSAQVVGNAFVEQYYHILHQSPGLVHRFYQDSSLLSRPDSNGGMTTVRTTQAINDKILSLKYEDYTIEIKTADAQELYEKGVIVLVTGCLTGKDNVRKKFTQSFFLAPQDKGYFVLNDVFRYADESDSLQINSDAVNSVNETAFTADATQAPEPVHDHLSVDRAIAVQGEDLDNGAEVCDPSDKEDGSVIDDEIVARPTNLVQNEINTGWDSAPMPQEDAPTKKSYAMTVKVSKGKIVSSPTYVPSSKVRQAPANADQQLSSALVEERKQVLFGISEFLPSFGLFGKRETKEFLKMLKRRGIFFGIKLIISLLFGFLLAKTIKIILCFSFC